MAVRSLPTLAGPPPCPQAATSSTAAPSLRPSAPAARSATPSSPPAAPAVSLPTRSAVPYDGASAASCQHDLACWHRCLSDHACSYAGIDPVPPCLRVPPTPAALTLPSPTPAQGAPPALPTTLRPAPATAAASATSAPARPAPRRLPCAPLAAPTRSPLPSWRAPRLSVWSSPATAGPLATTPRCAPWASTTPATTPARAAAAPVV